MPPLYRMLEVALYAILNFLPFMLIALYPFRDKFRFSSAAVYLFLGFSCLVQIILGVLASFADVSPAILSVISTLIYAALYFIMIKAHAGQVIFTLLMLSNVANLIVMCAKCLEGIFYPELAIQDYRWSFSLFMFLVEAVLLPPLFFFVKKTYVTVFKKEAGKAIWWYLWLIPATFYIVWYSKLYSSDKSSLEMALDPQNAIFLLIITLGSMLVYQMVVRLINTTAENLSLTEQNYQLAMQKIQYDHLQERINEARQARHDIRHHITAMDSYLSNGEYDKLREYLKKYKRSVPDDSAIRFCDHYTANAILLYFAHQAKEHRIDFDVLADIPENIPIADNVLSVVLGNLLENAVEACCGVNDRTRSIVIRSKTARGALFFEIDNTYTGTLKKNAKGYYLSSKHSGRGIGLASVRTILQRAEGLLEIDQKDGFFRVSVYLPFPTE